MYLRFCAPEYSILTSTWLHSAVHLSIAIFNWWCLQRLVWVLTSVFFILHLSRRTVFKHHDFPEPEHSIFTLSILQFADLWHWYNHDTNHPEPIQETASLLWFIYKLLSNCFRYFWFQFYLLTFLWPEFRPVDRGSSPLVWMTFE